MVRVVSKNEYSLFLKIEDLDIDAFLHCNDLTYLNNAEEELTKHNIGEKLKVKVLEVKAAEQKVRVGLRQTQPDPFDWFNDKKVKEQSLLKLFQLIIKVWLLDLRVVKWTLLSKNLQLLLMQLMLDPQDLQVVKELTVQ